jgi:hypothetical protein
MAQTMELKGTAEWDDPWSGETDGAAVALLSPEEFRVLVARLVADNKKSTKVRKAA